MSPRLRFGLGGPRRWRLPLSGFAVAVFAFATLLGTLHTLAAPTTIDFENPPYTVGSPNGQDGWVFTGPYDVAVVSQSAYPSFGAQSLRISNASASGSFGDMPFSKSTPSDAGETTVDLASPWSNHTGRKNGFEAEFSFASATPLTPQPGLRITVSPDRGDGARMGWAAIRDEAAGLAVDLQAYDFTDTGSNPCARFTDAVPIATGLDRTVPHKLKFVMRFAEGFRNDIVQIYVDDALKASTPTWEEYYRFCSDEQGPSANGTVAASHATDSLLFRISETGTYPHVPAYVGAGFLIDNMSLNTVDAPAVANVFVRTDGSDITCDGSLNASAASSPEGKCAFKTVGRGVDGVDAAGTVNVGAGTFAENLVITKAVTLKGANAGKDARTAGDARVAESIIDGGSHDATLRIGANVTLDGFTIKGGATNYGTGIYLDGPATGSQIVNNIITNNQIGIYPQCTGACTISKNLLDGNNANPSGSAAGAGIYTEHSNGLVIDQNEFKNHDINSSIIFAATAAGVHQSPAITKNLVLGPVPSDTAVYLVGVSGGNIANNKIVQTNGAAISLAGGNSTITIQNNDFRGSAKGLRIQAEALPTTNAGVTVNNNAFGDNATYGLNVVDGYTGTLDATSNWWGKATGPTNAGNPGGAGASVLGSVNFVPFLGHGTDTQPLAIGFQPESTNILVGQLDQTFVRLTGSSTECDGSADVDFNASLLGKCAVGTVQKGVDNVKATGTVNIAGQTFVGPAAHVVTSKSVNILGASRATTILDGFDGGVKTLSRGIEFQNGVDGASVKKLTIKRWNDHGLIFGGAHGANVGSANIVVDDVESSDNGDTAFAPGTQQGSARGIVVWDGNKSNITITNSVANNNSLVGIETQDGTVANAVITGNSVSGNRDAGMGVLGPKTSLNLSGNTVSNNGRFGIEVKNADGPTSGPSTLIVENNAVARSVTATDTKDHAGIVVMRRGPGALNVDQPAGVIVRNNNVANIRANAPGTTGEGFCIVVEGVNMSVLNNNTVNCDVGIQVQKGNTPDVQSTTGFDRGSAANYSGIVEQNNIASSNTIGLRGVGLTANSSAARNWWGNANGPTTAANPGGTGSSLVGSNLTFSPWLADGTDTNAALGFQPNLSPLGSLATQGINVAPSTGLVTTENGGQASFAIVLASQPTADVTIGLSSSDTNEGTVAPASLTFTTANWNVPQTATVTGVGLGAPNGNAAYTIVTAPAVSTDTNFSGINPADVSVTNNAAPTPTISISDASITEGDAGTSPMTFNVTLSQASPHTVKVDYVTQDQTALGSPAGIDYVTANATLTFNPGETSKPVVVQIVGNLTLEPTKTFLVNLSNPSAATILDGQAVGTINDNDLVGSSFCSPRPNISIVSQSIGGRQLQVTIKADTTSPNEANALVSIQFDPRVNATVQMPGQASVGTSPITLTAGTKQLVFFVTQTDTTKAFQVPFTITDGCGAVKKFVGGGKDSVAN